MPVVLVAFDADEAGQTATRWWLQKLENTYGLRLTAHDVNEMLLRGHDIRKWIEKGIHDYHQQDACPTINP